MATDEQRREGLDIADFLIKKDWKGYKKQEQTEEPQTEPIKDEPEQSTHW